jgi:thiamine-phosphate pyrophosphorylase
VTVARAPAVVLVTDPAFSMARTIDVVRAAGEALREGGLLVQHRDKTSAREAYVRDARLLLAAARSAGARFVVNGDANVAREIGADGAHVPGGASVRAARAALGGAAFVSAAAHDDDDVRRAIDEGATAVLVSPIFASPGKGPPRGLAAIASARAIVDARGRDLLVYALGGVDASRAASCIDAGADGVAVIRALLGDDVGDPRAAAAALAKRRVGG